MLLSSASPVLLCWLCRNVHDITLSYTFFKVDEDEADNEPADSSSSGVKLHGPGEVPAGIPAAVAAAAAAGAPLAPSAAVKAQ
jgi:heterodisulfide reductase subunit A-like polyferredoxin